MPGYFSDSRSMHVYSQQREQVCPKDRYSLQRQNPSDPNNFIQHLKQENDVSVLFFNSNHHTELLLSPDMSNEFCNSKSKNFKLYCYVIHSQRKGVRQLVKC